MYNDSGDKKMKKLLSFLCCCCLLLTLSGCRVSTAKVCTTNYPVSYLVDRISGGFFQVCNISSNELIQRAQIVSDFEKQLEDADALFMISNLEPYMSMYSEEINATKVQKIDLAQESAVYKFARYTTTLVENKPVTIETPYYEGALFESIDTYEKDVTLWMDPISMLSMGKTVTDELVKFYPENEKIFRKNYDQLEIDLAQLDAAFQRLSQENQNIAFVSMTPNFGNWQKSYGFRVYPIMMSKYGALPTAEQLDAMKRKIKEDQVKYIVEEENMPEDVQKLFEELEVDCNLQRIQLKNLSSINDESKENNKDYLTLMYENLAALEAIGR